MNDLITAPAAGNLVALAGALAHLAQHLESGCERSAYLATLLLDQVADDPEFAADIRQHARQLVDVLERDPRHSPVDRLLAGGCRSPLGAVPAAAEVSR